MYVCRNPVTSEWYEYNDEKVTKMQEKDIKVCLTQRRILSCFTGCRCVLYHIKHLFLIKYCAFSALILLIGRQEEHPA